MRFEHNLRVQLKERRNRLYKTGWRVFDNELAFFVDWLESEPYVRALLAELDAEDINLEKWKAEGGIGFNQNLNFPDTESARAKICLDMCRTRKAEHYAHEISTERSFDAMLRDFVEVVVDPLVYYLEDRIEEGSAVLGLLYRYKRHVEWFRRRELFDLYEGDTTRGEAALDSSLREYLLDQGLEFPFSQPESPSGKADVAAGLESEDPLALEVKLYLPDAGKDDGYVRQGFAQAYRYASDYGLPAGYLLVFNLTPQLLLFEPAPDAPAWPATVRLADKTIFLVSIHVHPEMPKASRDRKLARHEITQAYLLEGVAHVSP